MYKIPLGTDREVCVYGKEDGNASEKTHTAHSNFFSVTQTHGTGIFVVEQDAFRPGKFPNEADALFTIHDKPLGVYVADCLPVVLVGKKAQAVIHCSWKTIYNGLIQKTLELFHHHDDVLVAVYLGPSIKHYVVGEEFDHYFPDSFLYPYKDRYLFDMPKYVISIFAARGVTQEKIVVDPGCTWTHTEEFRGYRRGDLLERNFVGIQSKSGS